MSRIIDSIAPRGRLDFWLRSLALVLCFAVADGLVGRLTYDLTGGRGWVDFLVTLAVGAPFSIFVMWVMGQQRELQQKLAALAATDMLTGLANRRAFSDRLNQIGERQTAGVLMLIDADHFKRVNDSYGHDVGDQCLIAIAEHLRQSVRQEDIVSRIGGEEFAIFLPSTEVEQGRRVADKICAPISIRSASVAEEVLITLSIGATRKITGQSLREALQIADAALYRAKAEGRNRTVWTTTVTPRTQPELFA